MGRAAEEAAKKVIARHFAARASSESGRLQSCAWDYGGMVHKEPALVIEPANTDEVLFVLKIAADYGVPVSTRGSAHSQSGQCLSERSIVL